MDISIGEKYKLRITSRRLSSGNYQVKFIMRESDEIESFYGYLLVKPKTTLKYTIQTIENQLDSFLNPFSLVSTDQKTSNSANKGTICMIFKS